MGRSSFFDSIFGKRRKRETHNPDDEDTPAEEPHQGKNTPPQSGIPYKKGNFIGQKYEVYGVLGHGGFGTVYLVNSDETKEVYALKTFRDEYLEDAETRKLFHREANVWTDLERHPYLVRAYFVDEVGGRLYVAMEYVAPNDQGLNTLDGYLQRQPPDLAQSLRWAIQFCHGMEYAYSKGVRCHRDIKPANIMISADKTVKITDFGLAGVLGASKAMSGIKLNVQQGRVGFSILEGKGCGTPTHMPPEQFTNAASCDERSDIYAFGIVLYQMAAGGRPPFLPLQPRDNSEEEQRRFGREMYRLHSEAPVPRLDSPLSPIIQRCLQKEPAKRCQTFKELRADLEPLLKRQTGETIKPPEPPEFEAWEYTYKGYSLSRLGRFDEAIQCCDRALRINPQHAEAWINKGNSLASLGRPDEAIQCHNKALEINPQHAMAWYNKGNSLAKLGRLDEAVQCYNKALEINPQFAEAWNNKGASFYKLGRVDEAVQCYNRALEINPQHADAWFNKGTGLNSLGRFDEAIRCYGRALEINPQYAAAWFNKAFTEDGLGKGLDAAESYRKFVELAPPQDLKRIEYARQRLREVEGR